MTTEQKKIWCENASAEALLRQYRVSLLRGEKMEPFTEEWLVNQQDQELAEAELLRRLTK